MLLEQPDGDVLIAIHTAESTVGANDLAEKFPPAFVRPLLAQTPTRGNGVGDCLEVMFSEPSDLLAPWSARFRLLQKDLWLVEWV
jgi:hypothetical protein